MADHKGNSRGGLQRRDLAVESRQGTEERDPVSRIGNLGDAQ
jgi:hypothetical protein